MVVYYPILKNSTAEINALHNLKQGTQMSIIPIIESKPISPNNVKEWWTTFRTLGTYFRNKIGNMKFIYDFNSAFNEIGEISDSLKCPDNKNLVQHCHDKLKECELNYIPCVHFDSPNWVLDSVLGFENNEIAIRIRCHDFNSPMEELILERVKEKIIDAAPAKKFHIILDFYNSPINYKRKLETIRKFSTLSNGPVVLALTNCPEDSDGIAPMSFTIARARNDYKTYIRLKSEFPNLLFGDYTVRLNPEPDRATRIDYYNTYLKIFYTTEDDYMIGKSTLLGHNGIDNFISICQEIIDSDVYKQEYFSYGDKAIKDCAIGKLKITNHQKTIEIGINHHIELTTYQLLSITPILASF